MGWLSWSCCRLFSVVVGCSSIIHRWWSSTEMLLLTLGRLIILVNLSIIVNGLNVDLVTIWLIISFPFRRFYWCFWSVESWSSVEVSIMLSFSSAKTGGSSVFVWLCIGFLTPTLRTCFRLLISTLGSDDRFLSSNYCSFFIVVFLGHVLWNCSGSCFWINVVSSLVGSNRLSSFDM